MEAIYEAKQKMIRSQRSVVMSAESRSGGALSPNSTDYLSSLLPQGPSRSQALAQAAASHSQRQKARTNLAASVSGQPLASVSDEPVPSLPPQPAALSVKRNPGSLRKNRSRATSRTPAPGKKAPSRKTSLLISPASTSPSVIKTQADPLASLQPPTSTAMSNAAKGGGMDYLALLGAGGSTASSPTPAAKPNPLAALMGGSAASTPPRSAPRSAPSSLRKRPSPLSSLQASPKSPAPTSLASLMPPKATGPSSPSVYGGKADLSVLSNGKTRRAVCVCGAPVRTKFCISCGANTEKAIEQAQAAAASPNNAQSSEAKSPGGLGYLSSLGGGRASRTANARHSVLSSNRRGMGSILSSRRTRQKVTNVKRCTGCNGEIRTKFCIACGTRN